MTFEELREIQKKMNEGPPVVLKIRMSLQMFERLQGESGLNWLERNEWTYQGVPFEVDMNYRPDWWSEHYRDKIVMHLEDWTFEAEPLEYKIWRTGGYGVSDAIQKDQRKSV